MTSIGSSSLAYSFGKSREKLVLFVTIWAFYHSASKTKHLCALMEPKQSFECGSWADVHLHALHQSRRIGVSHHRSRYAHGCADKPAIAGYSALPSH